MSGSNLSASRPMRSLPRAIGALSRRTEWRCLMLVALGIIARLPALQGEFIWDDRLLTEGNPLIKSPVFVFEVFRHYLFPGAFAGHYRPVQTVSYIFDYFLWNNNAFGFHLSSVAWHVASGVLLYFLLNRILITLLSNGSFSDDLAPAPRNEDASVAAFLIALLWTVHPAHSAAIDYVAGRADSLAFFFSCGGWLLYLRARETSGTFLRRWLYVLSAFAGVLALCSRESGLMWVVVFLAFVLGFEARVTTRGKLTVVGAALLVVAIYAAARHLPETHAESVSAAGWTAPMRLVLMLRALGDYGRVLVYPTNLHVERTVFDSARLWTWRNWATGGSIDYLAVAGVGVAAVLVAGSFRAGIGQRARVFGAIWFLIGFLPISNLFDLNATVAEHWLYLPSVGLLIFLFGVLYELPARCGRVLVALSACAVVALTARSAIRSSDWVDPETFFRRTFAAGGTSSRIGVNLGVIYAERGEHAKAEAVLRKVLQVSPNYLLAKNNLALALSQQGKMEEAAAMLESTRGVAIEKADPHPSTWDAALHLAQLRYQNRDTAGALAVLKDAEREFPGTWELVRYNAKVLADTEGHSAALELVTGFVSQQWWHFDAAMCLGRLLAESGDSRRAEAVLRRAVYLDVHSPESYNALAELQIRQGRMAQACDFQRRAVVRAPEQPRQRLMLAQLLGSLGRNDEMHAALADAERLEADARRLR